MSTPKTTKAWTVEGTDGFDCLKWHEQAPLPEIGDHDVLVKIHAASLNFRDISIPKVSFLLHLYSHVQRLIAGKCKHRSTITPPLSCG
jgi:NADPH:quinone reductase-like Zn-dependent oxidoreductase